MITTSSLNLALASLFTRVGTPQTQIVAAPADVEAWGSLYCAANGKHSILQSPKLFNSSLSC